MGTPAWPDEKGLTVATAEFHLFSFTTGAYEYTNKTI
jgi:hypothetical protein